jgi:response regulator RpfG family c-di-GMP phosphodiesterase
MNAPPRREKKPRRRVCVLYAEDDRLTSVAISRLLTVNGFKVETAANGQEALRKLLSQPAAYDFIITDQVMPLLTGEEWLMKAGWRAESSCMPLPCLIPWPHVCGNRGRERTVHKTGSLPALLDAMGEPLETR